MRVSVVVSTYNGAKTIIEQLDSLLTQTRQPEEVLICDDASSDKTAEIVRRYIQDNHLDHWQLHMNSHNKGWKKNFYDLLCEATGDLVFPCDQDDIWHADKIEIMAGIMEQDPDIYVLEGQPHRWNCNPGHISGLRKKVIAVLDVIEANHEKSKNSKRLSEQSMDRHFLHVWPGCTLCLRRSFFQTIKELWIDEFPHDAFICIYSKILGHYYRYDYEVIEWRRYGGSSTQAVEKSRDNRLKEIKKDEAVLRNLLAFAANLKEDVTYVYLKDAEIWNSLRYNVVSCGSGKAAIRLLCYLPYYVQKRRFLSDVYYGFKGRSQR